MGNLSKQEFYHAEHLFNVLEISESDVVGQDYTTVNRLVNKKYRSFSLKHHPDTLMGELLASPGKLMNLAMWIEETKRRTEQFQRFKELCDRIKEYIAPLKDNLPCNNAVVAESFTSVLTLKEFLYMEMVFQKCSISKDEVVGKDYNTVINALLSKSNEELKNYLDAKKEIEEIIVRNFNDNPLSEGGYKTFKRFVYLCRILSKNSLNNHHVTLYEYILPMSEKKNLVIRDKRSLSVNMLCYKLFARFNTVLSGLALVIIGNIIAGCYFSWLLTGMINLVLMYSIKFTHASGYIYVCSLTAFSSYLLISRFMSHGLTFDVAVFTLLLLYCSLRVVLTNFFTDMYVNKQIESYGMGLRVTDYISDPNVIDQLKQRIDTEIRANGDTRLADLLSSALTDDLLFSPLSSYDMRRLLTPIVMPFLKRTRFAEFEAKLAERNFGALDDVNLNAFDINFSKRGPVLPI